MLRGIYSAASAMELSMQKMNLFAQNLSNSQTTGYKKKVYAVHSFKDMLVNIPDIQADLEGAETQKIAVPNGSYIDDAGVKQQQGELKQTGSPLNVAIMGEGAYFQLEVNDPNAKAGDPKRYTVTRNGSFRINEQNYLVNQNGDYVLDTKDQRIRLRANSPQTAQAFTGTQEPSMAASNIQIDKYGHIQGTDDGSGNATQIKLVKWTDDPNLQDDRPQMRELLKKYGYDLPADSKILQSLNPLPPVNGPNATAPAGAATRPKESNYTLHQGYLESSNVDISTEMIMLMMTSKDYDMSQKLITTEDKVLDKTINEMGRLQ